MEPIGLALARYSPAFLAGIVVFISALYVFYMAHNADDLDEVDDE